MCLPLGTRYSTGSACRRFGLDRDAALVLVVLAEFTIAVDLAMIATSLGRRASNSSATRGRPPVMSLGLGAFARDTGQHVAGFTVCAILDRQDRVHRQDR
jgi:hypothetical protein